VSIDLGVFDSGVGGLAVLREIRTLLPRAQMVYVADTHYVPYGNKPAELIRRRSTAITRYLVERGAAAVVVACNTATTHSIDSLRRAFPLVPIVGMEPAIKPASLATRSRVVGILATGATLAGERVTNLIERNAEGIEVVTQPCPGLVEQVETGDLTGPETVRLVRQYTGPLLARGSDSIVLGCTHYTLIADTIQRVVGPSVTLFDGTSAVARRAAAVMGGPASGNIDRGRIRFFTTGEPDLVRPVLERLWSEAVPEVGHLDI